MPPADLSPALRDTLSAVGAITAEAREPWWIISSAAAALHGAAPIDVADVDILLSVADARAILPGLGLAAQPGTASERFRSDIFATWQALPLAVDFMAGFSVRDEHRWTPVALRTRLSLDVWDTRLFLPSRPELQALFTRFGRPKDLARARLLAALPTADRDPAHLREHR